MAAVLRIFRAVARMVGAAARYDGFLRARIGGRRRATATAAGAVIGVSLRGSVLNCRHHLPSATGSYKTQPSTLLTSMPLSAAILRTDGGSGMSVTLAAEGGTKADDGFRHFGAAWWPAARLWRIPRQRRPWSGRAKRRHRDRVAGFTLMWTPRRRRCWHQRDLIGFQLTNGSSTLPLLPARLTTFLMSSSVTDFPAEGRTADSQPMVTFLNRRLRRRVTPLPAIA